MDHVTLLSSDHGLDADFSRHPRPARVAEWTTSPSFPGTTAWHADFSRHPRPARAAEWTTSPSFPGTTAWTPTSVGTHGPGGSRNGPRHPPSQGPRLGRRLRHPRPARVAEWATSLSFPATTAWNADFSRHPRPARVAEWTTSPSFPVTTAWNADFSRHPRSARAAEWTTPVAFKSVRSANARVTRSMRKPGQNRASPQKGSFPALPDGSGGSRIMNQ